MSSHTSSFLLRFDALRRFCSEWSSSASWCLRIPTSNVLSLPHRALKESGEASVTQEQLHDMLNEVDTNKNGQIELGEYLELMSNIKTGKVAASRLAKAVDRDYEKTLSVDRSGGGL